MSDYWPTDLPPEVLAEMDRVIETAAAWDVIIPGIGEAFRSAWASIRPAPSCDCSWPPHRWNCELTPIWAQTMRELDINPWTVVNRPIQPLTPERP